MLIAIIGLVLVHYQTTEVWTFNYNLLLQTPMSPQIEYLLMLGFFIAFAVKMPVVPLHAWLPDAHSQAPTAGSQLAYQGAVIQMIAHGLSAAGLFILCGQLYERLHTRDIRQMGGLWSRIQYLPALSLFFAMATLGIPGTGNFVGEFMILCGSFQVAPLITVIATFGLVFASVYSLVMIQRAYYGEAKSPHALPSMTMPELSIILLLVTLLILLGIYPQPILDTSDAVMTKIQQRFAASSILTTGL